MKDNGNAIPFDLLPDEALVRRREVQALTGKSRSALYSEMAAGRFPKAIKLSLSGRAVGWRMGDLRKFLSELGG